MVVAWLVVGLTPSARAWDKLAAAAIRVQVADAAVANALPGYTCYAMRAKGRSLWFYYQGSTRIDTRLPTLEMQIRFNDGLPLAPLVNCWVGARDTYGPVTNLAGDEAIAFDRSLSEPQANGVWIHARVGSRFFSLLDGDAPFAALIEIARTLAASLPTLPMPTSFELDADEREQPNPEYIERDREMFVRVTPGLLASPPQIETLTPRESFFEDPDLGFGYHLETRSSGGGYVSIFGTVLWREAAPHLPPASVEPRGEATPQAHTTEAVHVSTYLPRAPAPQEVYHEFYRPIFGPDAPTARLHRYWGYDLAAEPLPSGLFHAALPGMAELAEHPDRAIINWLMTPFSGTSYSRFSTRQVLALFTRMDARACLFLLRSKNPATRLIAIETLRRRAAEWEIDLTALAPDFDMIYQSVPVIYTQSGDVVRRKNSRALVDQFVLSAE